MKNKKICLILSIFLLTGCSTNYDLLIENNIVKENINIYLKNQYELPSTYDDEPYDSILDKEYYAINKNNKKEYYNKEVIEKEDYKIVNFSYDYNIDDFINASIFDLCFESVYVDYKENKLVINIDKSFNCLYLQDEVNINITTNYKVISNNAMKVNSLQGNYTWTINEDNVNDLDIQMFIDLTEKNDSKKNAIKLVIFLIIVLGIIFSLIKIKKNRKI